MDAALVEGTAARKRSGYNIITIEATKKPEDVKLRVAAYARVSSDSEDQENSLAAQTRYYTSQITEKPQWEMVDIYADATVIIGLNQQSLGVQGVAPV